jgi:hypothetical protein
MKQTGIIETTEVMAFSVDAFCKAHQISRPFLYTLWNRGEGPEVMKLGSRTLIPAEAAAKWRERMTRAVVSESGAA